MNKVYTGVYRRQSIASQHGCNRSQDSVSMQYAWRLLILETHTVGYSWPQWGGGIQFSYCCTHLLNIHVQIYLILANNRTSALIQALRLARQLPINV